jgi:hypothetical protein
LNEEFSLCSGLLDPFGGVALSPGHRMTFETTMFDRATTSAVHPRVTGKRPRDDCEWDQAIPLDPPVVMSTTQTTGESVPVSGFDSGHDFPFSPFLAQTQSLHFLPHQLPTQSWDPAPLGFEPSLVMSGLPQNYSPYGHDGSQPVSDDGVHYSSGHSASAGTPFPPPAVSDTYVDQSFAAALGPPSLPMSNDFSSMVPAPEFQNWEIISRHSSEDHGDTGAAHSGSISPTSEAWQKIPSFTDPATEVTAGHVTPPEQSRQPDRSPRKHNRRQLKPEEREQTGKTRQIGACMRCQMQRVRVSGDS